MDRRAAVRRIGLAAGAACAGLRPRAGAAAAAAAAFPLRRSDVVFMYQADAATYAAYGATVLAWGGDPTSGSRRAASGVAWHGSVGMVTEFAAYHERFPRTWRDGLCRDVHGQPIRVPWLTDHRHRGEPFWWCCTRQPQFRRFLASRVESILAAGADGLHVDDHLGSAGALFLGACFCERCVFGFRGHLSRLDPAARGRLGVAEPAAFDYAAVLRRWLADCLAGETRRVFDHPLWREWSLYQLRGAAEHMLELRALAARVAGRPVPVSANAGLLWPNHLADYRALDWFSAETDHDAGSRRLGDRPLLAYRMADALGRPYAATASGQDWAFVKEHGLHRLVTGWIAAGYAAGHRLMAPHRQWCHTEEKGTHWYDGPGEVYAPLYRFVRENAALLDGHDPWSQLTLVMPHRAWAERREPWLAASEAFAAANLDYRLALGSDDLVDRAIERSDFAGAEVIVSPATSELTAADRRLLDQAARRVPVVETAEAALDRLKPAVRVLDGAPVRVHLRSGASGLVLHVLNRAYDGSRDAFAPLRGVGLALDRRALGVAAGASAGQVFVPGAQPCEGALAADGTLRFDLAGPWALVRLERG